MQRRWKLSLAQRADMWNRWKAGQSLNAIGRVLGKDKQVIHFLLARRGGIAPPVRRRSQRVLTLAEREDISRGIASGSSLRVIAQAVGRASSTVSREVARHGGRAQYRASQADQQAWNSALCPNGPKRLAGSNPPRDVFAFRQRKHSRRTATDRRSDPPVARQQTVNDVMFFAQRATNRM